MKIREYFNVAVILSVLIFLALNVASTTSYYESGCNGVSEKAYVYNGSVVFDGGYKTSGKIVASLYSIQLNKNIDRDISVSTYINFKDKIGKTVYFVDSNSRYKAGCSVYDIDTYWIFFIMYGAIMLIISLAINLPNGDD